MTKEKLTTLLRDPYQIGEAVGELSCLIENYPYFSAAYMLYVKGLQLTDVDKLELQLSKSALNARDRVVLYDYLYSPEVTTEEVNVEKEKEEEKISQSPDDLIDSFLKADAKIKPGNSQYEADLSVGLQETPDFYTETLADIYAMQGYKNKAIDIYEQLILKYPEKHIYFAAQIKRLK